MDRGKAIDRLYGERFVVDGGQQTGAAKFHLVGAQAGISGVSWTVRAGQPIVSLFIVGHDGKVAERDLTPGEALDLHEHLMSAAIQAICNVS